MDNSEPVTNVQFKLALIHPRHKVRLRPSVGSTQKVCDLLDACETRHEQAELVSSMMLMALNWCTAAIPRMPLADFAAACIQQANSRIHKVH